MSRLGRRHYDESSVGPPVPGGDSPMARVPAAKPNCFTMIFPGEISGTIDEQQPIKKTGLVPGPLWAAKA
jgi:hypothetical protein